MLLFDLPTASILAFAATSLLIELTPGPNMTYLAVLSMTEGRRAGFAATAGVALGLLVIGLAAALGLTAIIAGSPALYQMLRWGGVAYLLWLAWEGWRESDEGSTESAAGGIDNAKFFTRGLITNLLNPKAGLFYVTVLPSFISPAVPTIGQAAGLSLLYVAIATAVHVTIVGLAGSARVLLANTDRTRAVRRVFAVVLAGIAAWLAWSTRA